ncbi:glutathionylspermidine synthase [Priestia aryabhattai]|uniref:glutathionylspermidine synthase n=1 Tax=Priestia aryabhattai TaxID=412384 RepID=UPI0035ABA5A3
MYIPQMMKQSISYLEKKIRSSFPLLNKIKSITPLMTTEQYEVIYPYIAHYLYQSLKANDYTHTLEFYDEEDTSGRILHGFFLVDNITWEGHYFIFTYEGFWLYNNQPYDMPNHIQEFINRLVCNSHECLIYNKPITKENFFMNNTERLKMEIVGLDIPELELAIYLEEEGLNADQLYNASSTANKKAIYASALSVLNSLANQPHLMKNYRQDDMTITDFAKHLQNRINQLEIKVRQMPSTDSKPSNFFNLFQ